MEERSRLAALLLRAGEAARAAQVLEKTASVEQPRTGDLWLLVLAYQRTGQNDRAKEWLTKAMGAKERKGASWQERQSAALWRKAAEAAMKGR
jgi:Tfp pilus assembly protein PilF